MGIYDDFADIKAEGQVLANLSTVSENKIKEIVSANRSIPADYISFLSEVGSGEIGNSSYIIYDGPVDAEEIYGANEFDGILLFGDDLQGFNAGFRISDWGVIEIDPSNMSVSALNISFEDFIRKTIKNAS